MCFQQNAHFRIPEDIKHGDELICSFPACRDGGVKFCYCAHCRIPVAKRNFRIRHHHFDDGSPSLAHAAANPIQGATDSHLLPQSYRQGVPLNSDSATGTLQAKSGGSEKLTGAQGITKPGAAPELRTVKVPCRARGMPPEHNFDVSMLSHFYLTNHLRSLRYLILDFGMLYRLHIS